MPPAFVVRFRPNGPWRLGTDTGARGVVDFVCHSDTLFSAVTGAMARLGALEEWLEATARHPRSAAVRLSSCFPYLEDVHFVAPPRTLWPPPPSARIRWQGARFVPLALVADLLTDKPPREQEWLLDGPSECLIPAGLRSAAPGPFRPGLRSHAAVDRLSGNTEVHRTACLEFAEGAGLWAVAAFADEAAWARWSEPLRAALRLLADSGIGGERSLGWGRSATPEFIDGELPGLLMAVPEAPTASANGGPAEAAYWLLSLFVPAADDSIDWQRGSYSLVTRGGRVESAAGWGQPKKLLRMVSEGSVLYAGARLRGTAPDVAPDGFPHPVFRSGLALAIAIHRAPAAERVTGAA
ncbi:MAG: hypothetical protein AAB225_02955 [Acidobacteriota bacterium]